MSNISAWQPFEATTAATADIPAWQPFDAASSSQFQTDPYMLQPFKRLPMSHYKTVQTYNSKQKDEIRYPDKKIMEELVISRTISFSNYNDIPVCTIERAKTFDIINKYKRCILFVEVNDNDRSNNADAIVTVILYNFKENHPSIIPLDKEELDQLLFRYFLKKKVMLISGNQDKNNSKPIYFYPRLIKPKAYIIGGHAGELPESFIVPDNCMVVVRMLDSALQDLTIFTEYFRKICTEMDRNILKDPYGNISTLIDKFGSVIIYGPGDVCPNFSYNLLMCWKTIKEERYGFCSKTGSGIIDIDKLDDDNEVCKLEPWSVEQRTELDMKLTQLRIAHESYFTSLFSNSIYPTPTDILERISYQKMFDDIYNTYRVTQEQLCNGIPGIYYNFVCRGTDKSNAIKKLESNINYLAPKNDDNKLLASLLEHRKKYESDLKQLEQRKDNSENKQKKTNKEKKQLLNKIKNLGNSGLIQPARTTLFNRISEAQTRKGFVQEKYAHGGKRKTRKRSKHSRRKYD